MKTTSRLSATSNYEYELSFLSSPPLDSLRLCALIRPSQLEGKSLSSERLGGGYWVVTSIGHGWTKVDVLIFIWVNYALGVMSWVALS